MKKSKRIKQIAGIIVIVLLVVAGVMVMRARNAAASKPQLQTDTVKRDSIVSSVSGNGVLEPLTTVEVKSNVGGTVVEMTVDEGDVVKAGQLIAKIDPADSISQLDQVKADNVSAQSRVSQSKQAYSLQREQTQANVVSAEQALITARQRLAQAEQQAKIQPKLTSESIKQASLSLDTARSDLRQLKTATIPQMISSTKSNYDQSQVSYQEAEKNLQRQKALLEKGFVSRSVVDAAESQYSSAKAQMDIAKSKLDTVNSEVAEQMRSAESKVSQAMSLLESAKANSIQDDLKHRDLLAASAAVKQAEASLASSKSSAIQVQMKGEEILQAQSSLVRSEATVKNAQTQLGYTTIVAPSSGVVVKKYAETGSMVTAGKSSFSGSGSGVTIVDIADTSRMQVVVDVDETDISKISVGQEVDVTVDAFPKELFAGKVTKVAPAAEQTQSVTTIPVTVELKQPDTRLKPQMNASCDFIIARKDNVLCISIDAVVETDNGTEVTVMANGQAVPKKVEIGLTGDEYCEVKSGLKEGDTIVIPEEDTSSKSKGMGGPGGPPPM
ncbi:MAG: efflux RND transporter periplasmic adaptor subunit [Armatimonadota bacterium]